MTGVLVGERSQSTSPYALTGSSPLTFLMLISVAIDLPRCRSASQVPRKRRWTSLPHASVSDALLLTVMAATSLLKLVIRMRVAAVSVVVL